MLQYFIRLKIHLCLFNEWMKCLFKINVCMENVRKLTKETTREGEDFVRSMTPSIFRTYCYKTYFTFWYSSVWCCIKIWIIESTKFLNRIINNFIDNWNKFFFFGFGRWCHDPVYDGAWRHKFLEGMLFIIME